MHSHNDEVLEVAVFGRQVQEFLNTAVGKYLVERVKEEEDEAIQKLKRILPWRKRAIQQLQNKIENTERFQQWLAQAIMDGYQATQILEGDE